MNKLIQKTRQIALSSSMNFKYSSKKLQKKILIADLFSEEKISELKALGNEVIYNHELSGASLLQTLKEFSPEILLVRSTKVTEEHINAKNLEVIIRAGSGYDTIDIKAANRKGIFVGNCPGKNSVAVAELVCGFILAADRKIPENNQLLKEKQWKKGKFSKSKGIKGRTLGIVGFGNIGREVAKRALAFDMKVFILKKISF